MTDDEEGVCHGRHHPRSDDDPRRGHQPALQLGPRICRCSAPWGSISRSASITGACTATGSAARKRRSKTSDLGALLVFDDNNIRYVTSTKIGEWARDKLSRWALLPRGGDPILWDFGSAAVHHKLYSPWLKPENCKAGLVGLRGTVDPAFGLMKRHAEEMRLDPEAKPASPRCRSASTSSSRR